MDRTEHNWTVDAIEHFLFGQNLKRLIDSFGEDDRLIRTWSLIERRCSDEDLRLEQAAREAGASVTGLNTLLKLRSGYTFGQLLRRYRVHVAAKLLVDRRTPVLDAALQSGFGSVRSLQRNFIALLGVAPRALFGGCRNTSVEIEQECPTRSQQAAASRDK